MAVRRIGGADGPAHVYIAYSAPAVSILQRRLCRSDGIWRCRQEQSENRRLTPMLVRTRHLPLLMARGKSRDQDHPGRSNARAQSAAGAAQGRYITAHLGMTGSILLRERSTQKPDQRRRARTTGSECPQPAGQSSSAAYRTAGVCVQATGPRCGSPVVPSLRVNDGLSKRAPPCKWSPGHVTTRLCRIQRVPGQTGSDPADRRDSWSRSGRRTCSAAAFVSE